MRARRQIAIVCAVLAVSVAGIGVRAQAAAPSNRNFRVSHLPLAQPGLQLSRLTVTALGEVNLGAGRTSVP